MAGTLTISTLSDGTNSTSSTNCIQGSAKAWVTFSGVGSTSILASYNVSSVTYNGTGNYTVNYTNAFSDTNYSTSGICRRNSSNSDINLCLRGSSDAGGYLYSTTQTAYTTVTGTGATLTNCDIVCCQTFR